MFKFKIGTTVVCVDNTTVFRLNDLYSTSCLKYCEKYTVKAYDSYGNTTLYELPGFWHDTRRFVDIKEFRKLKLQKICSNQEI